jgi:hypothetical protein
MVLPSPHDSPAAPSRCPRGQRVRRLPASPAAKHRGKVWKPLGFHHNACGDCRLRRQRSIAGRFGNPWVSITTRAETAGFAGSEASREGLETLVSYGGLVRSRSQAPGPPSLRPAKLGYARPQERRSMSKLNGTADRQPSGQKDRLGAQVVLPTFGNSPYRCQGREPVSARSGLPKSEILRERSL